jgi:hypothetical protein
MDGVTLYMRREDALRRVLGSGGVLLTTYGMVLHNAEALSRSEWSRSGDEEGPLWDVMILDEVGMHAHVPSIIRLCHLETIHQLNTFTCSLSPQAIFRASMEGSGKAEANCS